MAMVAALLVLAVLTARSAYAVEHVVGGSSGWSQATDYSTWVASQTFTVGDTLCKLVTLINVHFLAKATTLNATTGNTLQSYSGGRTTITLDKPGPMYSICPRFGHCQGGMKLAINIMIAMGSPPATPSPHRTPPSTPSKSPPPSSGSAAGTDDENYVIRDCQTYGIAFIKFTNEMMIVR
ncbi:uclacyanin-3-like [Diospyros lotus]|uniref:uclacyanin-3-like n=1 Tax=Diospyros lotus TaxID=55363 RepID=UPI002258DBD8|nr:uclacyanin-3-like [Diospyros lotus]